MLMEERVAGTLRERERGGDLCLCIHPFYEINTQCGVGQNFVTHHEPEIVIIGAVVTITRQLLLK